MTNKIELALKAAIEELEAQGLFFTSNQCRLALAEIEKREGLVSVEDRLPELYKRVLVKGSHTFVASLHEVDTVSKEWGVRGNLYWAIINDVWEQLDATTHWEPLPTAPKE